MVIKLADSINNKNKRSLKGTVNLKFQCITYMARQRAKLKEAALRADSAAIPRAETGSQSGGYRYETKARLIVRLFLLVLLPWSVQHFYTLAWPEFWILVVGVFVMQVWFKLYVPDPELWEEREQPWGKPNIHWGDLVFTMSSLWLSYILAPILAAYEHGQSTNITEEALTKRIARIVTSFILQGISALVCGNCMRVNTFFSGIVRIQTERGHKVCDVGPYTWVRHPAYAAFPLLFLGNALLLNSRKAFIIGIVATIIMWIRAFWEDRILQQELPGYRDYSLRVPWRLIPGLF